MMWPKLYSIILACLLWQQVRARAVFAHFMVSNTAGYTVADWEAEMELAIAAHIDAFAMNIAKDEPTNEGSLGNAFLAAQNVGFYLFFSFDYAGNGAWDKATVIRYIQEYANPFYYWHHKGKPLVSTFEGPDNAEDWLDIKTQTGCFFVPDWSSVGAKAALELANGVADGLFSWAAWPYGPNDMDTYVDASYIQYLHDKSYMMPVSPWFFTNMPGYDKNWLWRGDDLWYDRWQQALFLAPEFIEIISWNDFGESHYIGPNQDIHSELADSVYTAFVTGKAPYNYVSGLSHDGWRAFLPFVIDMYKENITTITREGVTAWFRRNPVGACADDGGTVGNTASQLQLEYHPREVLQDKIFFSALLGSPADVSVTIDGVALPASWIHTPSGDVGIYHGSVSFTGHAGNVAVAIHRSGAEVVSLSGDDITSGCYFDNEAENYNTWVGSEMATGTISATPPYGLADQVCVAGWGKGDFLGLCNFSCSLGYCPVGACVCTKMGPHPDKPAAKGVQGYPAAGRDANFAGLCAFSCNYGYCPSGVCDTVQHPLTIPTRSPFVPDTCVSGTGQDSFAGLCSYSCNFGFCPIHHCTCTGAGPLIEPPPKNTSITGYSPSVDDSDLCMFACQRGYCPPPICQDYSADDFVCGASEDDYDVDCGETMACDFTKSYGTLDDLASVMDTLDPYCISYYSINVLGRNLDDAMVDYNTVVAGDYDKKFDDYVDYIKDTIPLQLRQFLLDDNSTVSRGNKYFECVFGSGGARQACPIDTNFYTGRVEVTYYLVDADGFYADLAATYGIQKEWVEFGEYDLTQCRGPVLGDYQCTIYYGFPLRSNNVTVDNPKDIITKALPGIRSLNTTIALTQLEINAGTWTGVLDDVIQTISTTVFLVQQAIDSMKSVVKIADDYDDEKEKRLVETILGVVLLVLPFVGELDYFTESMVVLGRMLRLATDVGLVGTTIYSVVEDPSLAPFTILTALMGGARTPETFETTAAARRKMTDEDIEALGPVFKNNNMNYQSVAGQCRKELST